VLEICEKENFVWDKLTTDTSETDSAAGKIAESLQNSTYRLF